MTTKIEKMIVDEWNSGTKTEVVKYLKSKGFEGEAQHIGLKQFQVSKIWSTYKPGKSTAKTDIKIGDKKISLKTANDHIMMCAKQNESIATMMSVASGMDDEFMVLLQEVSDKMKKMVSGVSNVTISKAKKLGDPIIKDAELNNKVILDSLLKVFGNKEFKAKFIKEILSGKMKFGNLSDASADYMLYLTYKPILHDINDGNYIRDIIDTIDIRIDFKSTQKTQGPESGKYRYWSVLQIISKEFIKESSMNEGIFNKPISFMMSIINKIKNWFDLFYFLEIEPYIEIDIKNKEI